ncbi:MAG: hypothetical protein GY820_21160 [Gammaproteobacteria bacterium]|nr:hypothetical protein [Gammaproteobacteria bacterium]
MKKLRAEAKQLPDVSLEELYVKLVEIHPKYKVDMNLLMEFIRMGEYCGSKLFIDHGNEKDYDSLTAYQILQFLYPLCLYPDKLSDYIGFPIDLAVKERDTYMSNISSYLKFDSNATLISFDTADDFRSWVLYMIVLSNYDSECPWSTSETYRLQFVCR